MEIEVTMETKIYIYIKCLNSFCSSTSICLIWLLGLLWCMYWDEIWQAWPFGSILTFWPWTLGSHRLWSKRQNHKRHMEVPWGDNFDPDTWGQGQKVKKCQICTKMATVCLLLHGLGSNLAWTIFGWLASHLRWHFCRDLHFIASVTPRNVKFSLKCSLQTYYCMDLDEIRYE